MGDAQVIPIDQATDEDVNDELQPGTTLLHGQYTIESFLNAGGFGITYRARDSLDRPVVIKECFPGAFCRRSRAIVQARSRAHQNELHSIVRLFVQEARSLSKLQHPNIVGVHQVFEENDTAYMALDFVEGRDLLEILDDPKARLDPDQIVSILRDILDAIGFVHDQGVLHRDISPDNILVSSDLRPVLIDFGAARQQATRQTRVLSALRVVKDGYSPQEFYVNGSEQGPYSDLYALGASFYHLIAGETPPDSQVRLTAIATGENDPYQPLRGRFPDYDEPVLAAIDKALAVLPKDRVQSAAEWISIMDGEVDTPAPVAAPSPKAKPKAAAAEGGSKSSKVTLLAGVAAVAVMAVGVIVTQSDLFSGDTATVPDAPVAETSPAPEQQSAASVEAPASEVATTTPEVEAQATSDPAAEVAATTPELPLIPSETQLAGPFAPASSQRPVPSPGVAVVENGDFETGAPREVQTALSAPRPVRDANDPRTVAVETDILSTDIAERAATHQRPDPDVNDPRTQVAEANVLTRNHREAALAYANRPIPLSTPVPTSDPVVLALSHRDVRAQGQAAAWMALSEKDQLPEGEQGPGTAPIESVALGAELQPEPEPEPEVVEPAPEVVEPTAPTAEAAPEQPEVAATPAPNVRADDVISSWSLALPFNDLRTDAEGATIIRTVEGRPVENREEFEAALREVYDPLGRAELSVNIGLGSQSGLTIFDQTVTLPIVQTIELPNGLVFEAKADAGGNWVTTLVEVPDWADTDAQVGDIMFAQFPSNERLTTRLDMTEILKQATAAGQDEFKFLALRDGGTFFVTITHRGSPTN